MRSEVSVSWGDNATYRFDLEEVQPLTSEAARQWLDEQFVALECEPRVRQGADGRQGGISGARRRARPLFSARAPCLGHGLCPCRCGRVGQACGARGCSDPVYRVLKISSKIAASACFASVGSYFFMYLGRTAGAGARCQSHRCSCTADGHPAVRLPALG